MHDMIIFAIYSPSSGLLPLLHLTTFPCHLLPHIAMLTTTGNSPLMVMCTFPQAAGHCSWNHFPAEEKAPDLQLPEAPDVTIPSLQWGAPAIMLTPFQDERKHDHRSRSDDIGINTTTVCNRLGTKFRLCMPSEVQKVSLRTLDTGKVMIHYVQYTQNVLVEQYI